MGDLAVVTSFDVAKHKHFRCCGGQGSESTGKPLPQFAAGELLLRRTFGRLTDRLGDDVKGSFPLAFTHKIERTGIPATGV